MDGYWHYGQHVAPVTTDVFILQFAIGVDQKIALLGRR